MKRSRDVFFGAVEHQDMPFERLVDEIQPERNLAYSPLFQTLFVLDQDAGDERSMGDVQILPFMLENRVARTDLVVHGYLGRDAENKEGRLKIGMEYNTDLFAQETIARFLRCYETLLGAALRDPDTPISKLPLLTDEERTRLLVEWNATDAPYPMEATHVQFEAVADRIPDSPALVFPSLTDDQDEVLSYRELDETSNQLARHLLAQGVEAGSLVGLALDRSADMVVALLGILKTGAAYVPLDPTYPADRIAYMIEDAGLEHCVTTSSLRTLLPAELTAIELDQVADDVAALDASRLDPAAGPDDRMYVIYTSGSTGRPKGVELEHRSVSNFLASMAREPGFSAGDRLLAVTTLSFDISVLEVMLPLVSGGTVMVAPREAVADGAALKALLERLEPEVMQATPATWRMLLLAGWHGRPDLKILCGGEALPRDLANELVPCCGELWNMYGPTETTIWSSVKRVEEGDEPVTIGRPIASTSMYVLDGNLQPVPVGVPGELYIGGHGLARGYLDRPELTEERFVPDPFVSGDTNGRERRMYRTGDKARWLDSGELECLGRIDNQVKLRGFRIELGEIESVLTDVAGVHQCVCVIREDTPGDQRLTAYYVTESDNGATVEASALRDAAQDKLPSYMVPAAFVELDRLPHTPNGKVDRNALLAMKKVDAAVADDEIVAPRTDVEQKVAAVWSEVLGVERVSINTNFFDMGGHSLLLAQVRARLQEVLHVELTIIELFQFPTVASLAAQLADRQTDSQATPTAVRTRSLSSGRQALMRRRRR